MIESTGNGRVVNIASASGPNFVTRVPDPMKGWWHREPPSNCVSWEELDELVKKEFYDANDYDGT